MLKDFRVFFPCPIQVGSKQGQYANPLICLCFLYIYPDQNRITMNRHKRVIFFAGVLLLLGLLAPYFFPETLVIKHSSQINAPSNVVFSQVNDLRNWELWSPWQPLQRPVSYGNAGVGRGGFVLWGQSPDESYDQRFTITTSNPHQMVELAMDFAHQSFAVSRIDVTELDRSTLLVWHMAIKTEGWKSILFWLKQKQNLVAASKGLTTASEIFYTQGMQLVERGLIDAFPYVSIRRQVDWEELNVLMGSLYEQLTEGSETGGYTIIGYPFAIYHTLGEDRVDIECGFPVDTLVELRNGIIQSGIFDQTACAITHFDGGFENLELAHSAVQQWMEERGLALGGSPMEIYQSIADEGANEPRWTTAVIYPF